jgi:hypothetical protein
VVVSIDSQVIQVSGDEDTVSMIILIIKILNNIELYLYIYNVWNFTDTDRRVRRSIFTHISLFKYT